MMYKNCEFEQQYKKKTMYEQGQYNFYLFVNSKSGDRMGEKYLTIQQLQVNTSTHKRVVVRLFDMCDIEHRRMGLTHLTHTLQQNHPAYVIICGGDGTILWVVEEVVKTGVDMGKVCFGVIPIGTGNDFSRSLGWGTAPVHFHHSQTQQLQSLVRKWLKCPIQNYDLWETQLTTYPGGKILHARDPPNSEGQETLTRPFSNYMGIGIDARVAYHMQRNRQDNKLLNLCGYSWTGICLACQQAETMGEMVEEFIEADSQRDTCEDSVLGVMTEVRKRKRLMDGNDNGTLTFKEGYCGLVCLNCTSYMAGVRNVWRAKVSAVKERTSQQFSPQAYHDGKVEFIGFTHELKLGLERFFNCGGTVTQGEGPFLLSFRNTPPNKYLHIDGEPYMVEGLKQVVIQRYGLANSVRVLVNKDV